MAKLNSPVDGSFWLDFQTLHQTDIISCVCVEILVVERDQILKHCTRWGLECGVPCKSKNQIPFLHILDEVSLCIQFFFEPKS